MNMTPRPPYPIRKKPIARRTLEGIRPALRSETELPIEILEDELMELASRDHALKVDHAQIRTTEHGQQVLCLELRKTPGGTALNYSRWALHFSLSLLELPSVCDTQA